MAVSFDGPPHVTSETNIYLNPNGGKNVQNDCVVASIFFIERTACAKKCRSNFDGGCCFYNDILADAPS